MGAACTKSGNEKHAFLKAAKDGDCAVVQQGILRHVDWAFRVQTWNGQSVFHLAARYGRVDMLEMVEEAVRFNPAGPDTWKKLLRMGHSTDAIIRAFANLQDVRCQTPLHTACIYGNADVATALLRMGATPWTWDELGGRTPLHYAASMGHVDCIHALLSHSAPPPTGDALRRPNTARTKIVDIANDSGYTPLHYAVWASSVASIRALISYDASLAARNVVAGSDWVTSAIKATPLHLAAHRGNAEVIKLLLSAYVQNQVPPGAEAAAIHDRRRRDPRRHVNANRQLPYHVAMSRNHVHLAELLHPDVPLSFILTPAELEATARLFGVPKLAVLAARMLQGKLVAEIDAAVAAMLAAPAPTGVAASRARSDSLAAPSDALAAAAAGPAGGAMAAHALVAAAAKLRPSMDRSVRGEGGCAEPAREEAGPGADGPGVVAAIAPLGVPDACGSTGSAAGCSSSAGTADDPLGVGCDPHKGTAGPTPARAKAGDTPEGPLPLPPAPLSPFLPPGTAAAPAAGAPPPTFNEAASAFALFAAEPFDDIGPGAAAGPSVAPCDAAQAGPATSQPALDNGSAWSYVPPTRNRGQRAAGQGANKVSPGPAPASRARSLRSLLTGGTRNRRSATLGAASPGTQQRELTPSEQHALEVEDLDELDDILAALQPYDAADAAAAGTGAGDSPAAQPPSQHASLTPSHAASLSVYQQARTSSLRPPLPPNSSARLDAQPSAGAGQRSRAGGPLGFWRRATGQLPQGAADASSRSEPASAGVPRPSADSAHARLGDEEDGSPRAPAPHDRTLSGALASAAPQRVPSILPPAGAGSLDMAAAAVLTNLAEAPQQALRRYRLLQLTHGVDLHDLLRDHSELANTASTDMALARTRSEAAGLASPGTPYGMPLHAPAQAAGEPAAATEPGSGGAALQHRMTWDGRSGAQQPCAAPVPGARQLPPLAATVGAGAGSLTAAGDAAAASNAAATQAAGPLSAGSAAHDVAPTPVHASGTKAQLAGQLLRAFSSQAASECGEGVCGVCFDQPDNLVISRCGHRLCAACSRELCNLNTFKPALCPFCRGFIGGFALAKGKGRA